MVLVRLDLCLKMLTVDAKTFSGDRFEVGM